MPRDENTQLKARIAGLRSGCIRTLGLYVWLVVVTGVRPGELCGLQIRDLDLDRGLVHVAFNYVVRAGTAHPQGHQDPTRTAG